MALSDEVHTITRALTGLGVEEKSLISVLGKWQHEERKAFRKGKHNFFVEDHERSFERLDDDWVKKLRKEFLRFQDAFVTWTMHPCERDARLAKKAIKKGPEAYNVLIEIACTRSSDELLGARRAYHSLFDHSIEEDVAQHVKGPQRKLLVGLVSAYRYEGSKVKDDEAKSDAKHLAHAIKSADKRSLLEDEEVIRILTTRSKPHLKEVYEQYKKISHDKGLIEEFGAEVSLIETILCLCAPHQYFAKVLEEALKSDGDKKAKKALTRVIVTRADADMKAIRDEFQSRSGVSLDKKIEGVANGNYKDLLVTLVARNN